MTVVSFDFGWTLAEPIRSPPEIVAAALAIDAERARSWWEAGGEHSATAVLPAPEAMWSAQAAIDDALKAFYRRIFRGLGARDPDDAALTAAVERYVGTDNWRSYPESRRVLSAVRASGRRVAVMSNWQADLGRHIAHVGLAAEVDASFASVELAHAKPDPRFFLAALRALGVTPAEVLHVGDRLDADVAGARAAGIRALFVPCRAPSAPRGQPLVSVLDALGLR